MSEQVVEQPLDGKEGKKFEGNMRKLIALLNGDKLLKRKKVQKDDFRQAMEELTAEDKAITIGEVKEEMKALVKEKIAFDKFCKEEEGKIAKAKEEKMKGFNTRAAAIFSKIEGVEELEATYRAAIQSVSQAPASTTPSAEEAQ